jgi:tRNA pseudouridine38-40 synthase
MKKSERTIKLDIAYDGTDFFGWQVQKKERTVQGVMQEALRTMHGRDVPLVGSGRTDSGVHAAGQVAHFKSELDSVPADRFAPALNSYLPLDVKVLNSSEASADFHARYSASRRVYRYYLYPSPLCPPYIQRYVCQIKKNLDIAALNEMAAVLIGEHDFNAFAAAGEDEKTTVRTIFAASFFASGPYLVFHIAANGFLRKMVRAILGTLLELEQNNGGASDVEGILHSRQRERAGTTAPASGLFLHQVDYNG